MRKRKRDGRTCTKSRIRVISAGPAISLSTVMSKCLLSHKHTHTQMHTQGIFDTLKHNPGLEDNVQPEGVTV